MMVLENTVCIKREIITLKKKRKKKEILNTKYQVVFDLLYSKLS